jgi:hypothetical protein
MTPCRRKTKTSMQCPEWAHSAPLVKWGDEGGIHLKAGGIEPCLLSPFTLVAHLALLVCTGYMGTRPPAADSEEAEPSGYRFLKRKGRTPTPPWGGAIVIDPNDKTVGLQKKGHVLKSKNCKDICCGMPTKQHRN